MFKQITLETLLKNKKINQRTYDKVKIAKEYIERKYSIKTTKNNEINAIIDKISNISLEASKNNNNMKEIFDSKNAKILVYKGIKSN